MSDFENNEYVHYPPFRPSLCGCVARDARMAAAVYTCCSEAFFSISNNIYRSLVYKNCDTFLSDLFNELAETDLERFRLLEELFLALNDDKKAKSFCYPYRKRTCAPRSQDSPALAALWERRRNIDCFEALMKRTEDRVVRSVFSKILSTEHLLCRRLEGICKV